MDRSALLSVLFVFALVVTAFSVPAATQSSSVAVTSVTTTPDRPNPGETFLVETTISNGAGASGAFEVSDVFVRAIDSPNDLARVENVGGVQPGNSLTVPLPMTIDEPGSYDLRVHVVGEINDSRVRLTYPLLVTVRESGLQLNVETDTAVVDAETTAQVTVVNGEQSAISTLRLTVDGENLETTSPTRVAASLASGASRTFNFTVTPTASAASIEASLSYTTASGNARFIQSAVPLETEALVRDVEIEAEVGENQARPPILVTLTNFGNAPIEDVQMVATADGETVARRPAPDVGPDEAETVRLNVSNLRSGTVDVRATYETAGMDGAASTTVDYSANPGRIELTGVDHTVEDGVVHISGSVSNVGLSEVNSVVVRVADASGVEPTGPYPDYFVGTVPASDFASFDLYARTDAGVETVPVTVEYLVGGEPRAIQRDVSVADRPAPNPDGESPFSGLLVAGGLIAVVIVAAIGVFLYRRRR